MESALLPTYKRFDLSVTNTNGTIVEDINGKKYLDFGSGIGVCNLGHRHPDVQQAIETQLQSYWHVSNLYHNPIQEEVAKLLVQQNSGDFVFFCNSGAEANEAAIKLARKATGKTKIISFNQSFHGRTFGAMAATGQEKIQRGFGPMLDTFDYVPYNDLDAVHQAIDENTAAIMLEMIQGEGGVIPAKQQFISGLRQLCKQHNILLIVDEVQTGIGRTGKPFAYNHYDISPDIVSVAKGLGNGLPVGAIIAKHELYNVFGPGSHATTFGGNPICMAAAQAVLQHVFQSGFLQQVEEKGDYLQEQLIKKVGNLPFVSKIRGKGLMVGIECIGDVSSQITQLMQKGLLVLSAGQRVIRLLPPLTVTEKEIDAAVGLIHETLIAYPAFLHS
ncbi:acetylornithine transaminase [Virgibacillus oceani]|uniref:Acetylornithine aminotransferase n=1 Tax=Virgibacillus oceani TaxID=1479511 RepID=A0A917HT16_9BACI|nr:acetylornithine transaminase [Virgibacillus oceani]GGG88394.1 acetylornithine aminotransferase [Virgibacillus oceani]